jgi:hypothetical protein
MALNASVETSFCTPNPLVYSFVTLVLKHIHMIPSHVVDGRNALPRILDLEHGFSNPPISSEHSAHCQDQGANK